MTLPGIFCLEGDWDADLRKEASVEPILELLARLERADYIHRNASIRAQLDHYLLEWTKRRYKNYPVLYLAFHGDESRIELGAGSITLNELGNTLAGRCEGRAIHFASCLTMEASDSDLMRFIRRTGARAVTGYQTEVEWLDSAAFEVVMFDQLLDGHRTDAFFRGLHREHGQMATRLGLVAATGTRVYRPKPRTEGV